MREVLLKLLAGRPRYLAALRPRYTGKRALMYEPKVPATVRIECRGAVRTHDAQVLDAVVSGDTIDAVEDQRHPAPAPVLALPAELAAALLQSGGVQAPLEASTGVGRVLDQDLFKGDGVVPAQLPALRERPERQMIAARCPHPQPAKRLGIRQRICHRLARLGLCISLASLRFSEHMFAVAAGRISQLGSPDSNRVLTGQSRPGRRLPHSPIAFATVPPPQWTSGAFAGWVRGLLRCPFLRLGLRGALSPGRALPSGPVRGVRGRRLS
jgi:hypothetical protein